MILLILIPSVLILVSYLIGDHILHLYRYLRLFFIYFKLPGPPFSFTFGIALRLALTKENELLEFFRIFCGNRKSSSCMVFGRPYTTLQYPPDLERAMASSKHITKGFEYDTIMLWLHEGLLTSKGKRWHERRRILTPAFHFKILEDCLPTINDNSRKMVNKLLSHNNQALDIEKFITLCSLDIICETAMGIKLNAQDNKSAEYVSDIRRVCQLMMHKEKKFWLRSSLLFKYSQTGKELSQVISRLHAFTENVIAERRELFKGSDVNFLEGKKRMAFLDCLLYTEMKNPGTFTTSDIREEVDTFLFEGHDTTSAALGFCFLLMGFYQEVQEKAVEELVKIFGDSDRSVTSKDLQEMKYLEMIIKETLRLYPSVPMMSRLLTNDLKLEDGTTIPSGTDLMIMPYLLHRNEELYEEPNKFIPERFSEENSKTRHPFSYIPFSAGPRNCIGQKFAMMEMKIVLSTVLRNCILQSITSAETLKLSPLLILRPDRPIQVKFAPRQID